MGGRLLPRDVGVRLRRVAPRRLLPRGPQEGRHARLLLLAADLGRDQLHVPQAPLREDDRAMARASAPGLRVHAEGEPADHPLEEARGRGGRRPRVRDDGQAARRPVRMRAVPMPAEPALRRGPAREVPRHASRETDPAYAMEFRHPSWAAARDALLERSVAWCVAETDDKDPKPEDLSWEPVGYLRLRKTEYTDEELATWAERIRPALDAGGTRLHVLQARGRGRDSEDGEAARGDAAGSGGEPSGALARRHLTASAVTPHAGSLPGRGGVGAPPRGGRTPPPPRGRPSRSQRNGRPEA